MSTHLTVGDLNKEIMKSVIAIHNVVEMGEKGTPEKILLKTGPVPGHMGIPVCLKTLPITLGDVMEIVESIEKSLTDLVQFLEAVNPNTGM